MRILCLLLFTIYSFNLFAQTYPIGQFSLFMEDPDRADRLVTAEMFYPAQAAGPNQLLADGLFPMIVFGHGFLMSYESYDNVKQHFINEGYIVMFLTTEEGLTPDHDAFAKDIAYMTNYIVDQAYEPQSFLKDHFIPKVALIGHSMGGGASVLAGDLSEHFETYIGLAPAETDPSAIAYAENITLPALILSGSSDGVTPPGEHHLPIFENLASECKVFVDIIGGAHCYFANPDFACDFGELATSSGITITREEQHQIFYDYTTSWLDSFLKDILGALNDFIFPEGQDDRVNLTNSCMLPSSLNTTLSKQISIFPNPASDFIYLKNSRENKSYFLYDRNGKLMQKGFVIDKINTSDLPAQMYFLKLEMGDVFKVVIHR